MPRKEPGAPAPGNLPMTAIYLSHPIHGTKVACLDLEAAADEQNGWTRYNPDTPSEEEAAPRVKRKYTRSVQESQTDEE